MTYITVDQFTKAMEAVVAGREDFVYESPIPSSAPVQRCVYQDPSTGQPSCLIGHALDHLGIPLSPSWDDEDLPADDVLPKFTNDSDLINGARLAQSVQDRGDSWGNALATFKNYVNEEA